jgi:hypothetical protein
MATPTPDEIDDMKAAFAADLELLKFVQLILDADDSHLEVITVPTDTVEVFQHARRR